MDLELPAEQEQLLRETLPDQPAAREFMRTLGRISQTADDLVDAPHGVEREDTYEMLWLLTTLPENVFYRAHYEVLQPLLQAALSDWFDANTLESGPPGHAAAAYVLRDSLSCILTHCVRLTQGYSAMRRHSANIRRFVHDESLTGYLAEHA